MGEALLRKITVIKILLNLAWDDGCCGMIALLRVFLSEQMVHSPRSSYLALKLQTIATAPLSAVCGTVFSLPSSEKVVVLFCDRLPVASCCCRTVISAVLLASCVTISQVLVCSEEDGLHLLTAKDECNKLVLKMHRAAVFLARFARSAMCSALNAPVH